ncbi:hypothetical protein LTS18_004820 [Coniosporium uncinatum]|uniref:Uncharacterized protein n=1 Tax=Coniosporium uncinatum TaxID=93489 RepID=A0ACC3DS30_9PEZI|nr:hypothetical protein LTS18_004820 [Coniosporium uncinatum]
MHLPATSNNIYPRAANSGATTAIPIALGVFFGTLIFAAFFVIVWRQIKINRKMKVRREREEAEARAKARGIELGEMGGGGGGGGDGSRVRGAQRREGGELVGGVGDGGLGDDWARAGKDVNVDTRQVGVEPEREARFFMR